MNFRVENLMNFWGFFFLYKVYNLRVQIESNRFFTKKNELEYFLNKIYF